MKNHARKRGYRQEPAAVFLPRSVTGLAPCSNGTRVKGSGKAEKSRDPHLHQVKCVSFHLQAKLNCSRVDWKFPVFTMLSMAASSPIFLETGGCAVGISSCSSTTSSFAAALFLPLRFFSARACFTVLDRICAGEGVGADTGVVSGTGAVTGGGVGGFSTIRGSGGEAWVSFVVWFDELLETETDGFPFLHG